MKRLVFCIYLYLGHDFLRLIKKKFIFLLVNYLQLIPDFCQKKKKKMCLFHIGQEQVNDFIKPGSFVAVAALRSLKDTVWFIRMLETSLVSTKVSKDDYQFEIPKGTLHLSGHFLELHEKKPNLKSIYVEDR